MSNEQQSPQSVVFDDFSLGDRNLDSGDWTATEGGWGIVSVTTALPPQAPADVSLRVGDLNFATGGAAELADAAAAFVADSDMPEGFTFSFESRGPDRPRLRIAVTRLSG